MSVTLCVQCKSCHPGDRCDEPGLKLPETCPVGHHCNDPAELFQCQPGTYQNEPNATVCKPCELGQYCPDNGMDTTIPCHIGFHQNTTEQTECVRCPEKTNCTQGMNLKY